MLQNAVFDVCFSPHVAAQERAVGRRYLGNLSRLIFPTCSNNGCAALANAVAELRAG
jgi:hypothetical protein